MIFALSRDRESAHKIIDRVLSLLLVRYSLVFSGCLSTIYSTNYLRLCFSFRLGIAVVLGEMEDTAYAKVWQNAKMVHYGRCASGDLLRLDNQLLLLLLCYSFRFGRI